MSELKAKHVVDVYDEYSDNPTNETQVYLKSEADKVIAEQKKLYLELQDKAIEIDKELTETRNQLRRQTYRRCLGMADWCEDNLEKLDYKPAKDYTDKDVWRIATSYYTIWRRRWLKIAEQFKEAK